MWLLHYYKANQIWSTCHCILLVIVVNLFWCMYVYQKLGQLHQGGIRDQHLSVQISLASNSGKSWLIMTTVKVNCEGMRWIIQSKFLPSFVAHENKSVNIGWYFTGIFWRRSPCFPLCVDLSVCSVKWDIKFTYWHIQFWPSDYFCWKILVDGYTKVDKGRQIAWFLNFIT